MLAARQRAEPAELGMQVQHHRKLKCEVRLTFAVEPRGGGSGSS